LAISLSYTTPSSRCHHGGTSPAVGRIDSQLHSSSSAGGCWGQADHRTLLLNDMVTAERRCRAPFNCGAYHRGRQKFFLRTRETELPVIRRCKSRESWGRMIRRCKSRARRMGPGPRHCTAMKKLRIVRSGGLARRDRKGYLNDGRIQNPSKSFGIVPLSNFVPRGFGFVHHSIAILYTKCQTLISRFATFSSQYAGPMSDSAATGFDSKATWFGS
jgi:hypothetical protein